MFDLQHIVVADVAAPLIVAGIVWILTTSRSARKEIVSSVNALGIKVNETNGRVIKLETEIADHVRQDDKEFARIADEQKDQWEKISNHIERRKGTP